jgi:hypothetical protein
MDDELWSQLLRTSSSGSSQMKGNVASFGVGRDMFQLMWKEVVSCMCAALDASLTSTSYDEHLVHKVLHGFERVCAIGDTYKLGDIVNKCFSSLCNALHKQLTVLNDTLAVSGAAAVFQGSGKKILRIVQSVFGVAHTHLPMLTTAWKELLRCILQLNTGNLKLLPQALIELDDFVDASGKPLRSTVALLQQDLDRKGDDDDAAGGGLTVGFFSLIWGAPIPDEDVSLEQLSAV